MTRACACFVVLFLAVRAHAETPEPVEAVEVVEVANEVDPKDEWYGPGFTTIDRTLSLMNGRTLPPGTFEMLVAHRTSVPFGKEPFAEFLGFDGGSLKIGIGLRYGLLEDFDIGVYRLNGTVEAFDTYEADARLQLLRRETHVIDLALRGGVSWFQFNDDEDAYGYFGQLIGSTVLAERLTLGGGLLFHSDSTNEKKGRGDPKPSTALSALAELRLTGALALDAETAFAVAGYKSNIPVFSFGPKIITNRHSFAFVISNTQYMSADGVVANTPRGLHRWVLGFNISREL